MAQFPLDTASSKWFVLASLVVGLSQMLRYMALAIAPVSAVSPIQRFSLVFRIYFGWLINPQHEIFSSQGILGTVLSLAGVVSVDALVNSMWSPDYFVSLLAWHWP